MTDTAQRVVRAARTTFAAHGYGGASMRTIAAEVGVTAMALYNYCSTFSSASSSTASRMS